MYLQKMYLQKFLFKFVLVGLLLVSLCGCNRDGEDGIIDERVGTYTLVRAEVNLGGESVNTYPPYISGTLTINSDGRFTMSLTSAGSSTSSSGTWNSAVLTNDIGETIFYSFDGSTLEFTLSIGSNAATYVWQKI